MKKKLEEGETLQINKSYVSSCGMDQKLLKVIKKTQVGGVFIGIDLLAHEFNMSADELGYIHFSKTKVNHV
jgi:hypothetical protein